MKKIIIKSNHNGVCPLCNSNDLDYAGIELDGDIAHYPWTCNSCKAEGAEYYYMRFSGQNIYLFADKKRSGMQEIELWDNDIRPAYGKEEFEKWLKENNIEIVNDLQRSGLPRGEEKKS